MVACIGDHFLDGVRESYVTATEVYGSMTGACCFIASQSSLCVLPPLGLGGMRNFMIMRACDLQFDYVMLVDNDVRFDDPETICKLVSRNQLIITPWFDQSEIGQTHLIADPMYRDNIGIRPLEWTVPYCVMFNTMVFKLIGETPYTESMFYSEDEYNSLKMRRHGVEIWQDTHTKVKLMRPPGLLSDSLKGLRIARPGELPEDIDERESSTV